MKKFDSPTGEVERVPHDFELRGEAFQAYPPKLAVLADLSHIATLTPEEVTGAHALELTAFVEDCLTDESRDRIQERFRDPADKMDLADLLPVIDWLIELTTGGKAPTSSNGSSPSRARTGKRSTARPRSKASTPVR